MLARASSGEGPGFWCRTSASVRCSTGGGLAALDLAPAARAAVRLGGAQAHRPPAGRLADEALRAGRLVAEDPVRDRLPGLEEEAVRPAVRIPEHAEPGLLVRVQMADQRPGERAEGRVCRPMGGGDRPSEVDRPAAVARAAPKISFQSGPPSNCSQSWKPRKRSKSSPGARQPFIGE